MTQPDIFDLLAEEDTPRRGSLKPPCMRCGRRHGAHMAPAVGLFHPGGPLGYRADYPGAPLRDTREVAMQDMCDWRVTRAPIEPTPQHSPIEQEQS